MGTRTRSLTRACPRGLTTKKTRASLRGEAPVCLGLPQCCCHRCAARAEPGPGPRGSQEGTLADSTCPGCPLHQPQVARREAARAPGGLQWAPAPSGGSWVVVQVRESKHKPGKPFSLGTTVSEATPEVPGTGPGHPSPCGFREHEPWLGLQGRASARAQQLVHSLQAHGSRALGHSGHLRLEATQGQLPDPALSLLCWVPAGLSQQHLDLLTLYRS